MREKLVSIGETIVNGIIFDPKNGERLRTMDFQEILASVPKLFDLLEERNIQYTLVGGIAQLAHLEGRNTQDIDLIIPKTALKQLPEIEIEDQNPAFARGFLGDLRVDFLFSHDILFKKVLQKMTVEMKFNDRLVRCASPEAIILLKLYALPNLYRQARFEKVDLYQNDVLSLLRRFQPQVGSLFTELAKHLLPSDLEEVRKIVEELQERITKSKTRFQNPPS